MEIVNKYKENDVKSYQRTWITAGYESKQTENRALRVFQLCVFLEGNSKKDCPAIDWHVHILIATTILPLGDHDTHSKSFGLNAVTIKAGQWHLDCFSTDPDILVAFVKV